MEDKIKISVENSIKKLLTEFGDQPYMCYTEHGIHARFYQILAEAIKNSGIKGTFEFQKSMQIGLIQKEYPTKNHLGRTQRQHWDIAIIDPKQPKPKNNQHNLTGYDFLKLHSVVEFGLNDSLEHLIDDIDRLLHNDSNVELKYIVHLMRSSENSTPKVSRRDLTDKYKNYKDILNIPTVLTHKETSKQYKITDINSDMSENYVTLYIQGDTTNAYNTKTFKVIEC